VKLLSLTGHPTARPAGNNEGGAGLLLVWRSVAAASNWLSLDSDVAKRRSGRYLPGERGWVKTKNRDYWRYEMEREGATRGASGSSSNGSYDAVEPLGQRRRLD
jgi:hypothetical protein